MQNGAAALEHNLSVTQTVKHTVTVWSSNSTRSYIPKRIEKTISEIKNSLDRINSRMDMTEIKVSKFEDRNDLIWRRERNNQKKMNRALRQVGKYQK